MTPKEKAKELVDKFEPYVIRYTQDDVVGYLSEETPILEYQKQCALIAVDEIIDSFTIKNYSDVNNYEYWNEVKTEIENL
jgi:hypothetical protein